MFCWEMTPYAKRAVIKAILETEKNDAKAVGLIHRFLDDEISTETIEELIYEEEK